MTAIERTHYLIVEGDKVVARCSAETAKERLAVEKEFARHPGAVLCLVLSRKGMNGRAPDPVAKRPRSPKTPTRTGFRA